MPISILAVSATPRKAGNSEILLDQIAEGATRTGARVEKVVLRALALHPCRACLACRRTHRGQCAIEDDMTPLLAKIRAADAYVLASPIYFFTVSAQMKLFIDRWFALFGDNSYGLLRGRRAAVALTYGDPDPLAAGVTNALGMFRDMFRFLGIDFTGWVHASCDEAGEASRQPEVLRRAGALGERLARLPE